MSKQQYLQDLKSNFSHQNTTTDQDKVLELLASFISDIDQEIFILRGYAGTGKTTLIQTLVKTYTAIKKRTVLLAPTGRASKVLSNYAKKTAFTIHKHIYYPQKKSNGQLEFTLKKNKYTDTLFIIDEASMIADSTGDGNLFKKGSMLDDVLEYVFSGKNCKLIFVGDTAQLPPVHCETSPALEVQTFEIFGRNTQIIELADVVRQAQDSGILYNATQIRETINTDLDFNFKVNDYQDIHRLVRGDEIEDALRDSYQKVGLSNSMVIVYSNKRAKLYNQHIRDRILGYEQQLQVGDLLIVVKNNYFWLDADTEVGFIANGDIIKVTRIYRFIELYGFRFAQVEIQMVDYPNYPAFKTILLIDVLDSDQASLSYEDQQKLYQKVSEDYNNETKYKRFQKVKNNHYFNALQVKYAYALTCHKSQGGQWNTIFIERPYLPNGYDKSAYRWLYTAITRAQEKLLLIGFLDNEFEG